MSVTVVIAPSSRLGITSTWPVCAELVRRLCHVAGGLLWDSAFPLGPAAPAAGWCYIIHDLWLHQPWSRAASQVWDGGLVVGLFPLAFPRRFGVNIFWFVFRGFTADWSLQSQCQPSLVMCASVHSLNIWFEMEYKLKIADIYPLNMESCWVWESEVSSVPFLFDLLPFRFQPCLDIDKQIEQVSCLFHCVVFSCKERS